ncbi:MAG: fibronectin type III-like domain-contianing protein [Flavobacterium sp.]
MIKAGETQNVTIAIPASELAYYDAIAKKWTIESGKYILRIGNSSRNILLDALINVKKDFKKT